MERLRNILIADDYKFDIYNRHIYFDQHLVTNDELNEWIKSDKTELNTITNGNLLFKPASQLSLKQMRSYCSFRGQQLMEAHIYDAATFLTADKMRSPFYWTKKIREKNISCEQIYTEECLTEFNWKIDSSSASWAGLYNSLGGVPEALQKSCRS